LGSPQALNNNTAVFSSSASGYVGLAVNATVNGQCEGCDSLFLAPQTAVNALLIVNLSKPVEDHNVGTSMTDRNEFDLGRINTSAARSSAKELAEVLALGRLGLT